MSSTVAVQRCFEYNPEEIAKHIAWLYKESNGPDPAGKTILLKPNILSDDEPNKATTTHPAVVEGVIAYLQSKGATVLVGDSPTFDTRKFTGEICGIRQVVSKCDATWVRFNESAIIRKVGTSEIKITSTSYFSFSLDNVSKAINPPFIQKYLEAYKIVIFLFFFFLNEGSRIAG